MTTPTLTAAARALLANLGDTYVARFLLNGHLVYGAAGNWNEVVGSMQTIRDHADVRNVEYVLLVDVAPGLDLALLAQLCDQLDAAREELGVLEQRRQHVEREWLAKYQTMEHKWAAAVAAGCVIEAERDRLRVLLEELTERVALHAAWHPDDENRQADLRHVAAIRKEAGL